MATDDDETPIEYDPDDWRELLIFDDLVVDEYGRAFPERIDGPTPNGGTYAIAEMLADGSIEITEYDRGPAIGQPCREQEWKAIGGGGLAAGGNGA